MKYRYSIITWGIIGMIVGFAVSGLFLGDTNKSQVVDGNNETVRESTESIIKNRTNFTEKLESGDDEAVSYNSSNIDELLSSAVSQDVIENAYMGFVNMARSIGIAESQKALIRELIENRLKKQRVLRLIESGLLDENKLTVDQISLMNYDFKENLKSILTIEQYEKYESLNENANKTAYIYMADNAMEKFKLNSISNFSTELERTIRSGLIEAYSNHRSVEISEAINELEIDGESKMILAYFYNKGDVPMFSYIYSSIAGELGGVNE
jgi:hypothetical protein